MIKQVEYSVVMTTCDSINFGQFDRPIHQVYPSKMYLNRTLASLQSSGYFKTKLDTSLLLCDSGSDDITYLDIHRKRCEVSLGDWKMCINENTSRALHMAAARSSKYVIFLQDDIAFCMNWIENVSRFLNKHLKEPYHMATLYTPYQEVMVLNRKKKEKWNYPINCFYGLQCVAMKKKNAHSLADEIMRKYIERGMAFYKGADMAVKSWHTRTYPKDKAFLACVPCLVDHTGVDSTLKSPKHKSISFKGEQFDPRVCIV